MEKITMTEEIKKSIAGFSEDKQRIILDQAWDLCCDLQWLAYNIEDCTIDPWDGKHEDLRLEVELIAVNDVIDN